MNAARRKNLAKASALIEEAIVLISQCDEEEQEALGNLPDSLREAEKARAMEENSTVMQDCIADLENARDNINPIATP